ncbi:GFA family protein [Microbulbifer pacificus]|uniref:GFA family protein n=1 Tax=Microbulbifer pacificus TaxID=407164 RepID=A0AAU0MY14_9GAMM|nr:GFA family protein [Microbulbifer pacificus]WOX04937.1 GFA family protein [Microbulbifer pacificus]
MNASGRNKGKCICGEVEYELTAVPMFVHCCHCTWCQRETGSAFAINALIEADEVQLIQGYPEKIYVPSNSGMGQKISRCPSCKTALWSNYGAAKDAVCFIRVGTLNNPDVCPPDIHIFTSTKQKWVELNNTVPVMDEYYQRSKYWPEPSIVRYKRANKA